MKLTEEIPDTGRKCEHDGCGELAMPCYLDSDWLAEPPRVSEYLCGPHAVEYGYCCGCGRFWGGTEAFEFIHPGFCDNCYVELREVEKDCDDMEGAWDDGDIYQEDA